MGLLCGKALSVMTALIGLAATLLLSGPAARGQIPERTYQGNRITLRRTDAQTSTVYALLVCDTDADDKIGPSVQRDLDNMRGFLQANLGGPGNKLQLTVLSGPKANPDEILKYYAGLKTNPTDVLFFYYSGHGGTDTSRVPGQDVKTGHAALLSGHFLALRRGNLPRTRLREAIEAKPHQLILILADCCSNRVALPGRGPGNDVLWELLQIGRPPKAGFNRATFESLFLRSKGVIDISAASIPTYAVKGGKITEVGEGESAVCNNEVGGIFTHVFLQLMTQPPGELTRRTRYPDEAFVDWFQLFGKLQPATFYFRLGLDGSVLQGVDRNNREEVAKRLKQLGARVSRQGSQRPFFFKITGE